MTGRTHTLGGSWFGLITLILFVPFWAVLVSYGVRFEINIFVLLAFFIITCIASSTAPDIDLDSFKDGNIIVSSLHNLGKIIFRDNFNHRSFITHSVGVFLIELGISGLIVFFIKNETLREIFTAMVCGYAIGKASHLVLDMFNPMGIYLFRKNKKISFFWLIKFRLKKKLDKLRVKKDNSWWCRFRYNRLNKKIKKTINYAATGGPMEAKISRNLKILNTVSLLVLCCYIIYYAKG